MKQTRQKTVWAIVIGMIVLGAGLLALGMAMGCKLVLMVMGGAMFFAAYLAYQSGMAYIERLYGDKTDEKKDS